MSPPPGIVYRFGPFRYDSAQRLLFRDDELVPLAPKALDMLQALLERRGQVVSKAELMKAVWPDCVVEEVGLARNVSLLRKALGDDAEAYIETIPKRGYRFIAEADNALGHGRAAPLDAPSMPQHHRFLVLWAVLLGLGGVVYWQFYWPSKYLTQPKGAASLAVVPFECLSRDLEQDAFSQTFTEALVEEISKLESVHVMSPSTVERYRRMRIPTAVMSRLLGLHIIVEGTAQTFGPQLTISVRLTDVKSGKVIWAQGYNTAVADVIQARTAVTRDVAAEIGRRVSPQ
jgi:DNA-binding winged helix-turn-helix (wHTH) protein/TolB-like protein